MPKGGTFGQRKRHRRASSNLGLSRQNATSPRFNKLAVDQSGRIESDSPVSKTKVRLTVGSQRVEAVEPQGATVSIIAVDPDATEMSSVEAIWTAFCHHVFFFASRPEAEAWAAGRANKDAIEIVSVDEAFRVGQVLSSTLLAQARER